MFLYEAFRTELEKIAKEKDLSYRMPPLTKGYWEGNDCHRENANGKRYPCKSFDE